MTAQPSISRVTRSSQDFESNRITFKVVVVGNAGVGKSCLIQQYTTKQFQENYQMTIGMDFVSKPVEVAEETSISNIFIIKQIYLLRSLNMRYCWISFLSQIQIIFQEVFKSLVKSFYKGAAGIILVYSIAELESFETLNSWASEINENVPDTCLKVLIGTQNDREKELLDLYKIKFISRKVPYEEGLKFKSDYNFQLFYETSALTGYNVDEAFVETAKDIYKIQMEKLQTVSVQRQSMSIRNIRTTMQNESLNLGPDNVQFNDVHSKSIEKKSCC